MHYRPFSLIGIYLAVGPIAEIVAMLMAGRLLARFEPRRVMIACCLIGFVRWCGLVAPPWPALVALLQTLHLVTFGLGYVCFVVFVDQSSHLAIAAQAQSFAAGPTFRAIIAEGAAWMPGSRPLEAGYDELRP